MRLRSSVVAVMLACCALLAAGQIACTAATYYVSPTGSDSNDGSGPDNAHAWASMEHADATGLAPGSIVNILPGTYQNRSTRNISCGILLRTSSGTAESPIIYQKYGTGEVIFDGGGRNHGVITISDSPSHHLVIDGIHFKNSMNGMQVMAAHDWEVKNCVFSDKVQNPSYPGYAMIYYWYCPTNHKFHHNIINGSGIGMGIQTTNATGVFYNNVITNTHDAAAVLAGADVFRNNIILNATYGAGHGIYGAAAVHSHNMLFGVTTPYGAGASAGLNESVGVDPLFVDAANGNYGLAAGSPAVDAGVYVGYAFKGARPDFGAIETDSTVPPDPLATVTGKVTDSLSGAGIAGVTVTAGGVIAATTDADGNYSLAIFGGQVQFVVTKAEYKKVTQTVTLVGGNNTVNFQTVATGAPVFYVSPTGNDANDGEGPGDDHAWATMENGDKLGAQVLVPGSTVIVLPGTYNWASTRDTSMAVCLNTCSGTAAKPITYKAQGEVIVDGGGRTHAMLVQNNVPNYIVLDGFHFRNSMNSLQLHSTTDWEIRNCMFTDKVHSWTYPGYAYVRFLYSGRIRFHHNIVKPMSWMDGPLGTGIDTLGSSVDIYNNVIDSAFQIGYNGSAGDVFRNNIIANMSDGIAINGDLAMHSDNMIYNVTYPYGGGATPGANETDSVDPMFIDAWGDNYNLAPGSPAIDAGAYVGLAYKGKRPDLGAKETDSGLASDPLATVTGKVTDTATGAALAGVKITTSSAVATTDAAGNYSLQIFAGSVAFNVRMTAYKMIDQTITLVGGNNTADFQMQPVGAEVYWVSPSGNDANDGEGPGDDHAWASMDRADSFGLAPGTTVNILPGYYMTASTRNVSCGILIATSSGTAEKPIVYRRYGEGEVIFDGGGRNHGVICIYDRPVHHIVIDGIHFKNTMNGVQMMSVSDWEIRNCIFSDRIENSSYPAYPMVYYWYCGTDHRFHHNIIQSGYAGGVGIYANSLAGSFYNNVIDGTTNQAANFSAGDVFKNNIIANCTGIGIYGTATLIHSNNLMYNVATAYAGGTAEGDGELFGSDPKFVDPASFDYHLTDGSPAVDSGVNVGFLWLGNAPDMGAFESPYAGYLVGTAMSMSGIKAAANGAEVATDEVIVSAKFGDTFYVETPDRSSGIRVDHPGYSAKVGNRIRVGGLIQTDATGERYIQGEGEVKVGTGTIAALAMNNRSLGGQGLTDGVGIDNIGLFVKTTGKLSYSGGSMFVDDGSGVGVKVLSDIRPTAGSQVVVTGASSCWKDGASVKPMVRATDIRTAAPVIITTEKVSGGQTYHQIWMRSSDFVARSTDGGAPNFVADPSAAANALSGTGLTFYSATDSASGATPPAQLSWWAQYEIPQSAVSFPLTGTWTFWTRATQSAQSAIDSDRLVVNGDVNGIDPGVSNPTDAQWFILFAPNTIICNNIGNGSATYGSPGLFGYTYGWWSAGGTDFRTAAFNVIDGKVAFRIYEREASKTNAIIDLICWSDMPNYIPTDADLPAGF